jgi:hypothetical protein
MQKKVLIVVGLVVLGLVVFNELSKVKKSKVEGRNEASVETYSGSQTESAENVANVRQQVASVEPIEESVQQQKKVVWNPEELSEAVKTLLGLDGKEHNYPELLEAIKALGTDLNKGVSPIF